MAVANGMRSDIQSASEQRTSFITPSGEAILCVVRVLSAVQKKLKLTTRITTSRST